MDPITIGIISVAVLVALILIGFHIAVALSLVSFLSLLAITGGNIRVAGSILELTAYSAVNDYVFAVIPLFVLMGLLTTVSGGTADVFRAAERALRRVTGGLGISTVIANAVFAAVTGVSIASAAVFSRLAVPEMEAHHYKRQFAVGIVASSSLLGMLIPPSILMIIFGVITEQSVGRLFAAGALPGVMVASLLCLYVWGAVRMNPKLVDHARAKVRHAAATEEAGWKVTLRPWPIYFLMALVLGGIYGGFFTPTEAAAVGAAGATLLVIFKAPKPLSSFWQNVMATGSATASIFLLLITAQVYSRMLALSGLPNAVSQWAVNLDIGTAGMLLVFLAILLLLGMILDSVSIILLTMPIMFPVIMTLGMDPVWFGIVVIVTIEIGLLTPPFGMVVFAMKAALPPDVRLGEIFRGTAPFLALAILVAFPPIATWLPNAIYN